MFAQSRRAAEKKHNKKKPLRLCASARELKSRAAEKNTTKKPLRLCASARELKSGAKIPPV
jgi:hypothetical protein